MAPSILKQKSYDFALSVVKTCDLLVRKRKEFILSKQFLRSGTSTGALIWEAEFAQSKADFISKLTIALKEANESTYWILLLKDADILDETKAQQLHSANKELTRMLVASIKTAKGD
jgi:four helix bundle protein